MILEHKFSTFVLFQILGLEHRLTSMSLERDKCVKKHRNTLDKMRVLERDHKQLSMRYGELRADYVAKSREVDQYVSPFSYDPDFIFLLHVINYYVIK